MMRSGNCASLLGYYSSSVVVLCREFGIKMCESIYNILKNAELLNKALFAILKLRKLLCSEKV